MVDAYAFRYARQACALQHILKRIIHPSLGDDVVDDPASVSSVAKPSFLKSTDCVPWLFSNYIITSKTVSPHEGSMDGYLSVCHLFFYLLLGFTSAGISPPAGEVS